LTSQKILYIFQNITPTPKLKGKQLNKTDVRAIAKAAGKTRYEGLPCKYGHGNIRYTSNYDCVECRRLNKNALRKKTAKYAKPGRPPKEKTPLTEEQIKARKAYSLAWQREYWKRPENIGKRKAKKAKRRCTKLQRTPKWLTTEELILIKALYDQATNKTKETGVLWHVDHIIPLRGVDVSGLHVLSNLKVIPAKENMQKGNSYII